MDSVGIISIVTGVGLALFGIALSIKFYLETAKLQGSMVGMLGKIEMLALSSQQIQNELIRSAWDRHVAHVGDAATPESTGRDVRTAVEDGQGVADETVGTSADPRVVSGQSRRQAFAHKLTSLDRSTLVGLRIVTSQVSVPRTIVRVPKGDPMSLDSLTFSHEDAVSRSIALSEFEGALRTLERVGIVESVRQDQERAEYFVKFAHDFVAYWHEEHDDLPHLLRYAVETAVARDGFAAGQPI